MSWFQKYVNAQQLDLFQEKEEIEDKPTEAKDPQEPNIYYMGGAVTALKYGYVWFQVEERYYAYILNFTDQINKVRSIANHSPAKALQWTRKNSNEAYEVTENYPMFGSILRKVDV